MTGGNIPAAMAVGTRERLVGGNKDGSKDQISQQLFKPGKLKQWRALKFKSTDIPCN